MVTPSAMTVLRKAQTADDPPLSSRRLRRLEDGFEGHDLAQRSVARPGDARDRIERFGLDLAVVAETFAHMEHQDLADDQPAARLAEFEALSETAFHRDRRRRQAWHTDSFARQRLQLQHVDL